MPSKPLPQSELFSGFSSFYNKIICDREVIADDDDDHHHYFHHHHCHHHHHQLGTRSDFNSAADNISTNRKLSPAPPTYLLLLLLLLLHLLLHLLQPPKLIPPAVSLTPADAVQNQILHSSPSLHFGFSVSSKKPLLHLLHSSCNSCNWQNQTKSLFGFIASCSFTGGWCRLPV